ncbi:MAG: membrane protein insertase YidC [Raineya sp.]|jgi:YidC/Oxa1 family membrane protein insertase|nr:membrane protein insertase YidC [Raineya sp.]
MMDRNQAIGMVIISVMIFVWLFFFSTPPTDKPQGSKNTQQQQKQEDLTKKNVTQLDTKLYDSLFLQAEVKDVVLENKEIKVIFSTQGGKIKQVLLKNYKTYDQKPLYLLDEKFSQMSYQIPTAKGKIDLYQIKYQSELKNNSLVFKVQSEGKQIEQVYTLKPDSYELAYEVKLTGFNLAKDAATLDWQANMPRTEKDATPSRIKSTITYYTPEGGYDYLSETNDKQEKTITEPIRWVTFKQQFFLASIFATKNNSFSKATFTTVADDKNKDVVKNYQANIAIPAENLQNGKGTFQFYLGPNKYDVLKKYDEDFSKNVGLGWAVFGWVNRFVVIPILDLLSGIGNYGIIIIVLVLILRAVLFPLSYKSYIGMAKMKVLKPEIDEIKARTGGDMQKVQQEQMELFRQVGINPLAGCIPMLLQMPILIAMFTYFPNAIELRQESFLWAEDLSTYDSILNLSFQIPFYGSHVSLFTILMTISTIVYTWFTNQTSTVEGPMKMVGYIMPVVFMFMLNSYPAGLSYYYLVSNLVSIGQQIGIKRLVNENKIRAILDNNRLKNKDKKKSGFQQRLEDALKAQQEKLEAKQKDLKNKQNTKK